MSETDDATPSREEVQPAPDTDVLVRDGGNGDVFLRFGADEGNRRVELLNEPTRAYLREYGPHDQEGSV